jgi:hypothetical protein
VFAALAATSAPRVEGHQAQEGSTPLQPYVDPGQLEGPASFLRQPWRGWLETVPATRFLDGIGIQYRMPAGTDHDAVLDVLADAGVRRARFEVPWNDMELSGEQLTDEGRDRLDRFLAAAADHDVAVLLVLNANSGGPTPHTTREVRVAAAAPAGALRLRVDDVQGIVPYRSGFSGLVGRVMAGLLVTAVDAADAQVTLGRPLPRPVEAGETLELDTLAFAPLHEVGSAAFEHTADGWTRYVRAVLDVAAEHDVPSLAVEVWNETAFGSDFLDVAHYVVDRPLAGRDKFRPGGAAWELARRTVETVDASNPGVEVIWGFSSTDFYATPVDQLPPGTDGASYHPYGTNDVRVPADFPPVEDVAVYDELPDGAVLAVPEGRKALGLVPEPLTERRLVPEARAARPPGTERFEHLITEHGCTPREAGIGDPDRAMHHKARCLLRYLPFWLNKGIGAFYASRSWHVDPLGNGLMDPEGQPRTGDGLDSEALDALERFVDAFGDVEEVRTPRPLDVEVAALGVRTPALTLPSGRALYHQDQLAVLPFQASDDRFVVAVYVLTYDSTVVMPPEPFRLALRTLAETADVRWYDPLTGEVEPVRDAEWAAGTVSVTVDVTDTARLLVIDESPSEGGLDIGPAGWIAAAIAGVFALGLGAGRRRRRRKRQI